MATTRERGGFRRLLELYHQFLCAILAVSILILVLPVSLQVFARFIDWLPRYIWTEEMARLLFVWTIMIGSIVGVRENSHFDVDMWPRMGPKRDAALRMVARVAILVIGLIFLWLGVTFTRFAWYRISELAELPLWLIHIAWPIAGGSWILFLGEQIYDDMRILTGKNP
ncbi:TRAP transporter small permease [Geminicoccus roseus]|uniref:TRAP transporter small permease n=1 Tax=Geminicoccus roseus TaxID=404900 RepID=UPI00042724C5|nr:TRAP transporter small permease [Geminicoccus roseus]